MDLVESMKSKVESYWEHLKSHDPYHSSIFQGTATPEMVANFLVNVRHLVAMTPVHMKLAINAANKNKLTNLAAFFEQKFREEQGHDQWASDDLRKISSIQGGPKSAGKGAPGIDASMKALLKRNEDLIAKDPCLYLAYIFFAEYICVVAGPEIVEGLEKKCRFPADSMTVIANHAELDKYHVDEWSETIRQLVDEKVYGPKFLKVLDDTFKVHGNFLACMGTKTGGLRHAS